MKSHHRLQILIPVILAGLITTLSADPYIGYVYPAGGQAGTTFEVKIGGQRLTRVTEATITGDGIDTEFIEYIEPMDRTVRKAKNARDKVLSEIEEMKEKGESIEGISVPDVPKYIRNPRAQPNAQLAETVTIRISMAPDAKPGKRELRVVDKRGISNSLIFHVSTLNEINEIPQPIRIRQPHPPTEVESLPTILNGQIMPGETDCYRFKANKGQRLVFTTYARALIPYLADAVPGWFQAIISIHDLNGNEIAFTDDYRFDPDPVIFFEPPADGEYELRIQDSIYRGREDFVYRIAMGELPFVTRIFPLGGKHNSNTSVSVSGHNLSSQSRKLDTSITGIHSLPLDDAGTIQEVYYAIDNLDEVFENPSSESGNIPQKVAIPCTVNGRIENNEDIDVFTFQGKKGDSFVAEVLARRLNTPLDSIITLTDSSGSVIAENDDYEDKAAGLLTHHADSYLSCELPSTGLYRIQIRDVQRKGGPDYAYRLRLDTKRPDFALRVVPSNISVPVDGSTPITIHVLRKDGFDGPVEIAIEDPSNEHLHLSGTVPAGAESARLTISATKKNRPGILKTQVIGTATINGKTVTRQGIPADDRMQAFLWRFLVPTEEQVVNIRWGDKVTLTPQLAHDECLKIPAGDSASFTMNLQLKGKQAQGAMTLGLDNPPAGISMQAVDVTAKDKHVSLSIDADEEIVKVGQKGYLIVSGVAGNRNLLVGMAPAIPYEIVE